MLDHIDGAPDLGDVLGLGNKGLALEQLKAGVGDLHLAGPLGFEALDKDFLAGDQFLVVLLGAGQFVDKVGAVLVGGINGDLVVPPALLGLDIALDGDLGVNLGGGIVGIAHDGGSFLSGSLLSRGFLGGSLRGDGRGRGRVSLGGSFRFRHYGGGLHDRKGGGLEVGTLVEVQEAFHIDHVADLQILDGLVDIGLIAAEIILHAELIGRIAGADLEVQVVGFLLGVLVGKGGAGLVIRLDGQPGKDDQLIHIVRHAGIAPGLVGIFGLGDKGLALEQLKAGVGDLHLAGPLGFEALDKDFLAGDQFLVVLLGAGQFVDKVGAVLVGGINGDLVVPPALLGLDIALDGDFAVCLGGDIVGIAQDGSLLGRFLNGSLLSRSFLSGSFLGGSFLGGSFLDGSFLGWSFLGWSLLDRHLGRGSGGGGCALAAGGQREDHAQRKKQRKQLFHSMSSFKMVKNLLQELMIL